MSFVRQSWKCSGVIGLRYSENNMGVAWNSCCNHFSFYFIIKACKRLPSGTVYAVFTGSGAAVIVLIDFIFFGADFSLSKVFLIAFIIVGVVELK